MSVHYLPLQTKFNATNMTHAQIMFHAARLGWPAVRVCGDGIAKTGQLFAYRVVNLPTVDNLFSE